MIPRRRKRVVAAIAILAPPLGGMLTLALAQVF
jgi:hypothetical protein